MSLAEAVTNVAVGFLLAFLVQGLIYPPLGIRTTPQDELLIALIFTAVSLLRSYLVRRAFETFRAAMRGRKPKPGHLKLLEGNPGSMAVKEGGPRGERNVPTCPAHLCPTAKAEWKRLTQQLYSLGIVTVLDRAVMAGYCQAYGRWVEAERKLRETPAILKMPSGYLQQNPWLTIANKQLELMQRYMSELGLSPVARARVDIRRPTGSSKFDRLMGPKPWEFRACDAYLKR
jgi:P27 family predicted phage terminase small subunit